MDTHDLTGRIRELRDQGHSLKKIARTLGLPPATMAPYVNAIIAADHPDGPPELTGCWISPGWSDGLTLPDHDWPDTTRTTPAPPA